MEKNDKDFDGLCDLFGMDDQVNDGEDNNEAVTSEQVE